MTSPKAEIMQRKLTYGLMVGFLVFLITANPSGTGENGREFLDWLSGGFDDTREFVGSLMGDDTADDDTNDLGEVVIPTVAPDGQPTAVPAQPESFEPTVLPQAPTEQPAVVEVVE